MPRYAVCRSEKARLLRCHLATILNALYKELLGDILPLDLVTQAVLVVWVVKRREMRVRVGQEDGGNALELLFVCDRVELRATRD